MSWRLGRGKLPLWTVASLSLGVGVLTAICEAIYYWLALGAPLDLVLQANLTLDTNGGRAKPLSLRPSRSPCWA